MSSDFTLSVHYIRCSLDSLLTTCKQLVVRVSDEIQHQYEISSLLSLVNISVKNKLLFEF